MEFKGIVKHYTAEHKQPKDATKDKYWIKTFIVEDPAEKNYDGYVYHEKLMAEFLFKAADKVDDICTKEGAEVIIEYTPGVREWNGKFYIRNEGRSVKLADPSKYPPIPEKVPTEKEWLAEQEKSHEAMPQGTGQPNPEESDLPF